MSDEELEAEVEDAEDLRQEERKRAKVPEGQKKPRKRYPGQESDIAALRKKHAFLADFSDTFLLNTPVGDLMKIETTALKMKELERTKDVEDKLALNKTSLATSYTTVPAGRDNRWNALHSARFLGGAACSTTRLWLSARAELGDTHHPPIGSYDMGSVGLAGFVSSKGWVELHNPASTKLSVKHFNINTFGTRSSSKKSGDDTQEDTLDIAEFKLALRVMRTAFSLAMPWNYSILALEGYFLQNNFCNMDLQNNDRKVGILVKFTDYVIQVNADRWRDSEPFLTTGELKTTWASFHGAQPQVSSHNKQKKTQGHGHNQGHGQRKPPDPKISLGICFAWNNGQCVKAVGTCATAKGRPLKHICDHVSDPAKPLEVCGKDHIRKDFH